MSSPKRHVLMSLLFILNCFSKSFVIRHNDHNHNHNHKCHYVAYVVVGMLKDAYNGHNNNPNKMIEHFLEIKTMSMNMYTL